MNSESMTKCTRKVICQRLFVSSPVPVAEQPRRTVVRQWKYKKAPCQRFSHRDVVIRRWRRFELVEERREWLRCCGCVSHRLVSGESNWYHITGCISHRDLDCRNSCNLWENLTHITKMAVWDKWSVKAPSLQRCLKHIDVFRGKSNHKNVE